MSLTPAQQGALKSDMNGASAAALGALLTSRDFHAVADFYNEASSEKVWKPDAAVDDIRARINWKQLTPTDPPDGTQVWANRALMCQLMQNSLAILLTSPSGTVRADLSSVRQGLQDCLTDIPSGVGGAAVNAGWTGNAGMNVRDAALQRFATRFEALFLTTDGVSNTSSVYGAKVNALDCALAYTS